MLHLIWVLFDYLKFCGHPELDCYVLQTERRSLPGFSVIPDDELD